VGLALTPRLIRSKRGGMSRHSFALSAVRVEGAAEYVNDYVDHPDL